MTSAKHIVLIILIPVVVIGGYFAFKENLSVSPNENEFSYKVNGETVMKYSKLNQKLNFYNPNAAVDTEILDEILQIENGKTKQRHHNSTNGLNLRYIIITKNKKITDINGKIVEIGDKIDGFLIINIIKNGVEIKTKKGIKWLYLERF